MTYLKQALSERVVRDLKKRSFAGIFIYPIALAVVLFADGYYFRHPASSERFFLLVTGISMARLVLGILDNWIGRRVPWLGAALFLGGICLTALIWGVGFGKLMIQPGEMNSQLLIVACTMGICAGGCVAFSPYLWLSLAYNLLILWPGILAMAVLAVNFPLLVLLLMFSIYMAAMSFQANAEYRTALENERLLRQKTRDLEKISNQDGLTGIYNRRFLDAALEVAWQDGLRNQRCMALVICDIDHFKGVNDTFGHPAGDEYLKTVARIMNQVFKRQTDICARFGGEEFVALVPDTVPGVARSLAEQLRKRIEETRLTFESSIIRTTVSVGVAELFPGPGQEKDLLIARADAMLYQAKQNGRNRTEVFAA